MREVMRVGRVRRVEGRRHDQVVVVPQGDRLLRGVQDRLVHIVGRPWLLEDERLDGIPNLMHGSAATGGATVV